MRAAMGAGRLIAGRYRLLDPIGRGAMGVVWSGRDELLRRDVAVKEVLIAAGYPGQAGGGSRRALGEASYERTLREARAAARLSHPGVVTVFDILDEGGNPWIVMELIHGRSLDQVIAEDGPLPPGDAARLGASLLSALAAAHAAGVLHRDVKPANVLVTSEGRVVLTDFGIAKIGADPGLTQSGVVVGTPGFTPPERIRGEAATPASDLWSLGATLYAAVEGRSPFDRPGGAAAICAGIAAEDAPRAPSAGPLAPAIDALLRRDPAARADAATAATLLAAANDGAGTSAGAAGSAGPGGSAGVSCDLARASTQDGTVVMPAGLGGFLAPPVFAELSMPGQPSPAGRPGLEPPAFLGAAGAQPGGPPGAWPGRVPIGPPPLARRARSGSWRLVAVAASVAAIVVAALLGLHIYSRSLAAAGPGAAPGAGPAGARAAASAASAGRPGGATAGDAKASAADAAPPAGYAWHAIPAASLGTAAGFVMAVPDGWQVQTRGQAVFLAPPGGGGSIEVSLARFAAASPVAQARREQATAIAGGQYPGYRPTAILPAEFRGEAAAAWRFTWRPPGAARATRLTVLATLPTAAGAQPYALSVSAPNLYFPAARQVFDTALSTFRPLPG